MFYAAKYIFGEPPNWMKSLLRFTLLYINFLYISKWIYTESAWSFMNCFYIVVYEAIKINHCTHSYQLSLTKYHFVNQHSEDTRPKVRADGS